MLVLDAKHHTFIYIATLLPFAALQQGLLNDTAAKSIFQVHH